MIRKKFGPAFRGLIQGMGHRSIRVQWILALLAVIAGCILRLTSGEWIAVILCIVVLAVIGVVNSRKKEA